MTSDAPAAGFDFYEHTADVGIHAWGPSLADAFAQAARGLVAFMVDVEHAGEARETRTLETRAETTERLLYQFLDEILFLFQTEEWVPLEVHASIEGQTLRATLRGEPYDPERHGHVHEIKAITFHEMEVRAAPPDVRVIVDI